MSKNYLSKEEAINQLYATITSKFEKEGVLQEVRCMLQSKMVSMMKGKNDPGAPMMSHTQTGGGDVLRDARVHLLNQLIMEYFHWHGFHYSAEMFATESSCENVRPLRESLEGALSGIFEYKTLPILLELVAELMERKKR